MDKPYFGTHYRASFQLRYAPSASFVETPRLEWRETILMNDRHCLRCWSFTTEMYAHNPSSRTLIVWPRRYIEAYRSAAKMPKGVKMGSVVLQAANGSLVPLADLGGAISHEGEQAQAVRSYLQRRGGLLTIEIHDIPGVRLPAAGQHIERLVMFDIGVEGLAPRSRAEQYLNVQSGVPQASWQREFRDCEWRRGGLSIEGLTAVAPPNGVANPTPPVFRPGEFW